MDGDIIIWGVIFKQTESTIAVENHGLAHWGSVILTINLKISLKSMCRKIDDFRCTDLGVSHLDPNKLYISTDCGVIIHCLANGGRATVKRFLCGRCILTSFFMLSYKFLFLDKKAQANCLQLSPFSPEYFMCGFSNGDINFYCRNFEKALITLSNSTDTESRIELVQWSYNHPLIFYVKDENNTIHIWDLRASDMFPSISVPFEDTIVSMKLSPVTSSNSQNDIENTYMVGQKEDLDYSESSLSKATSLPQLPLL